MDGSCAGFGENLSLDDHVDADAFEAALEPLPTWDGVEYSAGGGNTTGRSPKSHASAVPPKRYGLLSVAKRQTDVTGCRQRAHEM